MIQIKIKALIYKLNHKICKKNKTGKSIFMSNFKLMKPT